MKKPTLAIFAAAAGLTIGVAFAQTKTWRTEADVKKQDMTLAVTMIDRSCTGNGYLVTGKTDLLIPVTAAPLADSKLRSLKSAYESTIGPVENKMVQSVIGKLTDDDVRQNIKNKETSILDSQAGPAYEAYGHELDTAIAAFDKKLTNILGKAKTGKPKYSGSSFTVSEQPAPQCRVQ